jgi:hypothetical protein
MPFSPGAAAIDVHAVLAGPRVGKIVCWLDLTAGDVKTRLHPLIGSARRAGEQHRVNVVVWGVIVNLNRHVRPRIAVRAVDDLLRGRTAPAANNQTGERQKSCQRRLFQDA